ncbi:hypothetical protein Tco_0624416 [Tanacetum coccineum]|uniref:Uncharacterized protein n=1 Tax=Tanacetum coccineum TaxID=301880 RepID=A0ABQ4WDV9_9ASTR
MVCRRTRKEEALPKLFEGPAFNLVKVLSQKLKTSVPFYGITHWCLGGRNSTSSNTVEPADRDSSRSQMRILCYKRSRNGCKNLHPNDFEDLFLLNIQEKLNHLPKTDKISLHTAVNMWIRNLVIRNHVGDLQLGIESYQTKINLERPNWDAADYYFKEDYTIVPKPRAVVYRDRNDQRKLMRLNELHKFSDGTLTRVMEKLDQMVKDFHLYEYNKGMETRKWSEDDVKKHKRFITASKKRLQIEDLSKFGKLCWRTNKRMEMEMENSQFLRCQVNNCLPRHEYTCYDDMKDLIKVSKLLQTLMSCIHSQVHKMAIHYKMMYDYVWATISRKLKITVKDKLKMNQRYFSHMYKISKVFELRLKLADLFTKALPKERFEFLVHKIGMRCMTPTQLERLAKLTTRSPICMIMQQMQTLHKCNYVRPKLMTLKLDNILQCKIAHNARMDVLTRNIPSPTWHTGTDSPFHLEAFSDSDYAGDNHDRRSTSGGCQYLGRRLVSWQCKKQTIVAISSTEAEYVAAASCCAQVLWMQNQLLDYGFNFMNTEIHIDNESTICIVKSLFFSLKDQHILFDHPFYSRRYEARLINVVKVHTDDNVADLLTKGFDLARFNFLVVTIGMMNP